MSDATTGFYEVAMKWRAHQPTPGLLMHNQRLADPTDPYTQRLAAAVRGTKKSLAEILAASKIEFEGALYHDEDIGPYIPARNILNCIAGAAGKLKLKSTIRGSSMVLGPDGDDRLALEYDGPRDVEGLWEKGLYLRCTRKQGQSRVLRTVPRWTEWELPTFTIMLDTEDCSRSKFDAVLTLLKRNGALGDFRPQHGRFDIVEVKG